MPESKRQRVSSDNENVEIKDKKQRRKKKEVEQGEAVLEVKQEPDVKPEDCTPIKEEPVEGDEGDVKEVKIKIEVVEEEEDKKEILSDSDDEVKPIVKTKEELEYRSRHCPYLDTIHRSILDFDFEKLCSVSLSNLNVYACLVCGKYFQGRGKNTHAYTHSVHEDHHVFLNLLTLKFYCLPDNYEVKDATLEDIRYVLKPTFTDEDVKALTTTHKMCRALDTTAYYQGIQGLNNIKANDYMNVILFSLCHIRPIRDCFLNEDNYMHVKLPPGSIMFPLVQRFGDLVHKLWNPRNFRSHISPHEMLQAVVLCSKKKFQFTKQGDPIPFLSWLLNSLHYTLTGAKIKRSSIIFNTFQGQMKIHSRKVPPAGEQGVGPEYSTVTSQSPFLYLMLDLPSTPLFAEDSEQNIIPQVPIYKLLEKFNNVSEMEHKTYDATYLKRYEITALPRYLILCIKRFKENRFFTEKNPTIVNFPISFDMAEFIETSVSDQYPSTEYNLISNICHSGSASGGTYSVHLHLQSAQQWFELQDLHVTKLLPQMITLSESYIQFYERADQTYKHAA